MAPPRIDHSPSARRDLDDIWDYLAREAGVAIADAMAARLFAAMRRAADHPLLHCPRFEFTGAPRRINVARYAIFYEPLPDGAGIHVWRVIHGARDLRRYVRPPPIPDETGEEGG